MPFVKVQKNKAYFKRFQVKYRRRREGKTDYQARTALVAQDKNKYNSPKYRLVVRFTNKDIIAQIVSSKLVGDVVHAAAYSHELKQYGMPVGLKSYGAGYATGLLLARRLLTKLKLAGKYEGQKEVNGEDYNVEALMDGPAPFRALLDVGLKRTSTGSKVFAVLKGACDGGIEVPHSEKRFVGYEKEAKKLNAEVLRKYIFDGHVADYIKSLKENDADAFAKQFSQYIKNGLKAEDIEKKWAAVHKAIRADPVHKPKAKKQGAKPKRYNKVKLSLSQRKSKIQQKMNQMARKAEAK